jgi:2-oxoisovalerate dehydrogenase E2 component (dihydrolipoyl transacylase)
MGQIKQFLLPDLGEGLTEGDLIKWTVAVGDTVAVNDTIAEVETVKAAVELPSPWAGVVTGLHAEEGTTVPVGTAIISIDVLSAVPLAAESVTTAAAPAAVEEQPMTLVGYGPRDESGTRRRRRPLPAEEPVTAAAEESTSPSGRPQAHRVLAKPPVRKLAKSLGVDLTLLAPTGPNGTVSRDDVASAAAPSTSTAATASKTSTREPGARETRIPIKGVRKHTAAAMVSSAFTAPHVTEFITVDVTAAMELRDRIAARREFRDLKVSPLLLVAKAVILASQRTPQINSTWDEAAGEIVEKHYINLGIAAATERGLIVPNIKDADQLSLLGLAQAMGALTDTARSGKTSPSDMAGGTLTITNIGVFGIDSGTPILNPGEAGIVAFGAIRRQPWVVGSGADERIEPRWVTQLAVSFDHRLVDGQQGSIFLADVAATLHDPGLALL